MVKWFSDFIGWTLGTSYNSSMHSVETYIYMASLIVVCVGVVIVLAEISSAIRALIGKL